MTHADYSSQAHRLVNLSHHEFVQMWAALRFHVHNSPELITDNAFLRGYMDASEEIMATKMNMDLDLFQGMLVDLGFHQTEIKAGQEPAEAPPMAE